MNFDDLKDQLRESFQNIWDKIQESSIYIGLRERYDNLSPKGQRLALGGAALLLSLIILLYPLEAFFRSGEYVTEFETKRALVSRMNGATREVKQGPNIPTPPPISVLEARVRQQITSSMLLPEQVISVAQQSASGSLIPQALAGTAILVRLSKLNLTQIINLGRNFEALHPSVKLKDLSITPGSNDAGYFDVAYELVPLAVPRDEPVAVEEPEAPARPNRRRGK